MLDGCWDVDRSHGARPAGRARCFGDLWAPPPSSSASMMRTDKELSQRLAVPLSLSQETHLTWIVGHGQTDPASLMSFLSEGWRFVVVSPTPDLDISLG